jgi:hypothetical protein
MKKIVQLFTPKIKYIILIYAFIQLAIIVTTKTEYRSDALYYYNLAQECIGQNEFYPARQHLYEDYIIAPLYINLLIIILSIYNSTITISVFNLLVILFQLLLLYKITIKTFSENTARLILLIYIIYLNTLGLMMQNYTELVFLLFISSSIYLFLLNKNIFLLLSGIILGGAIAIRPVAWALIFALITMHFITSVRNKKIYSNYFYIYAGALIFILCFGGFTYLHFGKFEFTSTSGPVNFLLGANDDATGGFNSTVYEKGKIGFIEYPDSFTYIQKGEFYQDQAFKWISANPIKWISLAPLKFFHTFGWDDIALSSLFGLGDVNFARAMRILLIDKNFDDALPDTSTTTKLLYFSILTFYHLFYYLLLIAIVLGIYYLFKEKLNNSGTILIFIFSLLTTLMIMITVGTPRYKYPIIILLLPFAAYYFEVKFGLGKHNVEKK